MKHLSELYRHWDHGGFDEMKKISKGLEDALGRVEDDDQIVDWYYEHADIFPHQVKHQKRQLRTLLKEKRRQGFEILRTWLTNQGWTGHKGSEPKQIQSLLHLTDQIRWPRPNHAKEQIKKHVAKYLAKLQQHVIKGAYNPTDRFYTQPEYSSKIHQLRIDIRRISQYAAFSEGLFKIDLEKNLRESAIPEFYYLKNSEVSQSPFATLPYKAKADAFSLPESGYLAVTQFVAGLEPVKAFALYTKRVCELARERLEIEFDCDEIVHSHPYNRQGTPLSVDRFTLLVIARIKKSEIFHYMAERLK